MRLRFVRIPVRKLLLGRLGEFLVRAVLGEPLFWRLRAIFRKLPSLGRNKSWLRSLCRFLRKLILRQWSKALWRLALQGGIVALLGLLLWLCRWGAALVAHDETWLRHRKEGPP
jgi:hypothetical protein